MGGREGLQPVPYNADSPVDSDPRATHPIGNALGAFVEELRGLREMLPVLSETAKEAESSARRRKQKALQKEGLPVFEDQRVVSLGERRPLSASMRTNVLRPRVAATGWSHAERDLGSAVLLMMSAHFDRFIGEMVYGAFKVTPEIEGALSREVSFCDVADLPNIEAVRQVVIEKEIEHILRDDRQAQLGWFESRCGMRPLGEVDQALVAELDDVAELRNLIAHHGGEVTNKVGFARREQRTELLRRYRAGQSVTVTSEDVALVHDVLFTAAAYIAQAVWRSLREDQSLSADEDLHELVYSRLVLEEFSLVQRTLVVTLALHETMKPMARLINKVNLAQAYKWLNDPAGCNNVLDSEKWGSEDAVFRFVVAVLRDEWESAAELMEICGREGLVKRAELEDWPVLREFRGTKQYKQTFVAIFG